MQALRGICGVRAAYRQRGRTRNGERPDSRRAGPDPSEPRAPAHLPVAYSATGFFNFCFIHGVRRAVRAPRVANHAGHTPVTMGQTAPEREAGVAMNLLDYLASEFAPFDEKPLGPVDSAVLSQFCMVNAEGIVPALRERASFKDLGTVVRNLLAPAGRPVHFVDLLRAERYADMFTGLVPGRIKDNLLALAASPRFRTMVVRDYLSLFDTQRQTQFAAMTFVQGRDFAYVGFRGTDTSFVGWRENFNMAYSAVVPAQEQAVRYLQAVAPHLPKRLFVGGHSKGGNLALYAALHAQPSVQERIERVFVHDGPGFKSGSISIAEWERLEGRIHRTVPQDSVVGMLMESKAPLHVVESDAKGLDQHSVFTWQVNEARDGFVERDSLTDNALFTDAVLDDWLAQYTDEDAARVVDALFKAIEASGAQNAGDILLGGPNIVPLVVEAAKNLDVATRDTLLGALGALGEAAARNATQSLAAAAQDATQNLAAVAQDALSRIVPKSKE